MDIKVHSIHFKADQKLIDFINDKFGKLEALFDQIVGSEVFLRLDKNDDQENKVSEIKILVPGKELFAKKQCRTFEEAIDSTIEALRIQVIKHKEKTNV